MLAFMSYQTEDRAIAASVSALLVELGISTFMAHEHIEVSNEWRLEILKQLAAADLFVPILSKKYYSSIWCKQESGIAAFRGMTIIPLSTDGSIPQGFLSHIQSTKIDPAAPTYANIVPGLAKHNVAFVIDALIKHVAGARSYRGAEARFVLLLPYLNRATDEQIVALLSESAKNGQICHAGDCATKYLPPLFASHGQFMQKEERKMLGGVLKQYER